MAGTRPVYFATPGEFRAWLERHHGAAAELLVGYYKVGSGRASMTWPESVREALCFGWIDGVRKRVDDECYTIRFTPRRKGSVWSAINIRLIAELEAAGLMRDAGRAVFEARRHKTGPKAKGYTTTGRKGTLDAARLKRLKGDAKAWEFFAKQGPGYKNLCAWWVMQGQQEETKGRRLAKLIAACRKGEKLR